MLWHFGWIPPKSDFPFCWNNGLQKKKKKKNQVDKSSKNELKFVSPLIISWTSCSGVLQWKQQQVQLVQLISKGIEMSQPEANVL